MARATAVATTGEPGMIRIVGLGASAGGLEPLERFIANVPPNSGLSLVVVQHMDPAHKGMLAALLQRVTAMQVSEATEAMVIAPDAVYVIPPNTELSVVHGALHLTEPAQPRGQRLPIDVLFCSLARDQGERAVGVVLSGMGADGTLGVQAIRSQGGLTLAQTPASAQFDSMPASAVATGCVDIIALPDDMPARILRVAPAGSIAPASEQSGDPDTAPDAFAAILALLNEHHKIDLSLYKTSTLKRRIERRLAVHGFVHMQAYAGFLRENPLEIELLLKEMLIGVTSFFRDPRAWQQLGEQVIPDLLTRHGTRGDPLRAWVPGCSTGEEAYSLAMTYVEVLDRFPAGGTATLKIFATDLSADAIGIARMGLFSAGAVSALSPARLARFFVRQGDSFLLNSSIREMVLFAQHDVILDPPFTRLDLLSCRNLMIYFSATLQRRLVPVFHYCLRSRGVLLLGGSETVGRWHTLFAPLDSKAKLYRRSDGRAGFGAVEFPVKRRSSIIATTQESAVTHAPTQLPNLQSLADHLLLQQFSPAAVLVNASGDIVYISGRTGRYLEPAAGKANWNIHVMARPGIRTQLSVALRCVLAERTPIELHGLRLEADATQLLDVSIQPIHEPKGLEGMVMIVFREVSVPPLAPADAPTSDTAGDRVLRGELARNREEAEALRREMQTSQEELQTANEELQSINEELQSANEELTTSKEESQSMNEELQTINNELQSKLDDLALAQSDMHNLLNSTDIATLFLDKELNVRRFTERVTSIFHLREGDIGRPLSDLATTLIYPLLQADVKETLRSLACGEKQIATTDGRWFSLRIMPYRTLTNVIQGAVITFVDITATKALESQLRKA